MYVFSRGCSKSITSYINQLISLYCQNKISQEDFITAIGVMQIYVFGNSEEEVIKWIENQSIEYCNRIKRSKT